jgi:hypothetical protein
LRRNGGRIALCGRHIGERDRARTRDVACEVEQVLDGDRNAGKARRRRAVRPHRVDIVGRRSRLFGMHFEEDAGAFARRIGDTGKAFLDQRPARSTRCKIAG